MRNEDLHLSDEDLLLTTDGELPARRAAQARAHLASCWECRARMAEIETTITDFVRVHRRALDSKLPPNAGPRALLKAQLAELMPTHRPHPWHQLRVAMRWTGFAYVCVFVCLAVYAARILYNEATRRSASISWSAYAAALPNPGLTPGSTRPIGFAELCSADHDEVIRPVPRDVQKEVFQEYGIGNAPAANYEVDYLITPGLGGSDDIRNLWPEPHYNTEWNSYVKDQLEDHLHSMVCAGKLGLPTAQQEIASNWISAYKRYLHTDKPIPNYSQSGQYRMPGSVPDDIPTTLSNPLSDSPTALGRTSPTASPGSTLTADKQQLFVGLSSRASASRPFHTLFASALKER